MEPTGTTLKDGAFVTVREARPDDGPAIAGMHRRCSLDTVFRRYLTAMPQLSPTLQQRLLDLHLTVVAVHGREVVGLAHLADGGGQPLELALMVEDAWQRRGVGRLLAETVLRQAEAEGHATVVACTLPSSGAVHALVRRLRHGRLAPTFRRDEDGLVRVTLRLSPRRGVLEPHVPPRTSSPRALSA